MDISTNLTHQSATHLLKKIQIIMVNTTLPANIGSAARAMHTMGLSQLTVIKPKHPIDATSISHAAGAQDILHEAKVVDSLPEALKNSQLIFAASSRSRSMPRPVVNPMQASKIITDFLQQNTASADSNVSILFGREDRGLTNDELALADYHIQIDANPQYPVLNVASAVQVISSFIYSHVCQLSAMNDIQEHEKMPSLDSVDSLEKPTQLMHIIRQEWDEEAITYEESEKLNNQLITLMIEKKLANADDLRLLPQRLSRLTSRMQLDKKEYQLINSILAKLQ